MKESIFARAFHETDTEIVIWSWGSVVVGVLVFLALDRLLKWQHDRNGS